MASPDIAEFAPARAATSFELVRVSGGHIHPIAARADGPLARNAAIPGALKRRRTRTHLIVRLVERRPELLKRNQVIAKRRCPVHRASATVVFHACSQRKRPIGQGASGPLALRRDDLISTGAQHAGNGARPASGEYRQHIVPEPLLPYAGHVSCGPIERCPSTSHDDPHTLGLAQRT